MMLATNEIKVSVIIPAWNAEDVLPLCLAAICNCSPPPHEIIVVDDSSDDRTAAIARDNRAKVLRTTQKSGPAAARNLGASAASGDLLMFLDADVVVQSDTIGRLVLLFSSHPQIAAVFGTYDDQPAAPNFLSQYKNLQHHYVHQSANGAATTFWAGCGAVRRNAFLEAGGFDAETYTVPSIEDIELGYRLTKAGYSIAVDKSLRVKHLKKWTILSHLSTEIFRRAIPWSRLIFEKRIAIRDLNLTLSHRISALLSWIFAVSVALSLSWPWLLGLVSAPALGTIVYLNRGLYRFFLRHRGAWFLLRAIPTHLLHYLYSSAVYATCWAAQKMRDLSTKAHFLV